MTDQEYETRNLSGFEGDSFMKAEFEKLIATYNIDLIIETGTYHGGTANQLSKMVKGVITIEVDKSNYDHSCEFNKSNDNVSLIFGDSVKVLYFIFDTKKPKNNTILFLDAHWGNVCPLLDELKEIAKAELKPVIIIHDFFVPNAPHLGYDSYNGRKFDLDFIKKDIDTIYGVDGWNHYYNSRATGAMRGIIYILPK